MKRTILLAGFFAVSVLTLYVGLILWARKTAAEEGAQVKDAPPSQNRLVPPLERIVQERDAQKKNGSKEAYHRKADTPKVKIFQTSYKEGTQVIFNHAQHVEKYKLACIECHHVERCSKCHLKTESHSMDVVKGKQALHENCIGCHSESGGPEECLECHKQ